MYVYYSVVQTNTLASEKWISKCSAHSDAR